MIEFAIFTFIFHSSYAINLLKSSDTIACNGERRFSSFDQIIYINWPQSDMTPTRCSFLVKAPINTFISARVYHDLSGSEPACKDQRILVSRDGDSEMRNSAFYCGVRKNKPLDVNSIGNEMTFAVVSNRTSGGLQVVLRIWKLTQQNCDCSWNVGRKIIGGTNASPNEFIAHVAFVTRLNAFNQSICGGTIISQSYILTCAHCIMAIKNIYKWNVVIAVGRHNISAPESRDTVYATSYKISSVIVHKGYNQKTNDNDIALVRTARYIKFNRGVGAACLPFAYEHFTVPMGTILTAVGFGSTQFAMSANVDRRSWTLQKVQLSVNNTSNRCSNDSRRLCAAGSLNKKSNLKGDSCQRDSGGGLYGYMRNRYVLFAVTSEGFECGAKNSYSINVYVAKYLKWIKSVVGNDLLCVK